MIALLRFVLFAVAILPLASIGLASIGWADSSRPNIILVMPDDMGYGDLGATGNPIVRTPNLDRFASESAELTNFYVSPVCSPTRACLMTGRYNYRTRVVDTYRGRSMMEPDEVTLAESLRAAGYATGIFGKWHLGDNYPLRAHDQGFDEALIHRGGGLAQPSEPIENARRYTDAILFRNGTPVQTKGYCTDVYFDAAIKFMEKSRAAGKPFFVYLPPNAPHGPFHDVPEELRRHYASVDLSPILLEKDSPKVRETVAAVFAMVENIDQNFGKLDEHLKATGQRDNTMVMFFTDNGPNTNRYVGPFREKKSDVYEGGIHTMFYARWPDRIAAGNRSDRIAAHIDVLPTVLAAADVPHNANVKLDGVNLLPLLTGSTQPNDWPDRTLFLQTHRGDSPVLFHHFAARTQDWKLLRSSGFGREMPVEGDEAVEFELYSMTDDLGESNDVATEHPDVVAKLKSQTSAWMDDVASTRPDNFAPPRIVIGSDAERVTDLSVQDWRTGNEPGWGRRGVWKVDLVDAGPYDVSVRWDKAIGEKTVSLQVGSKTFETKLPAGETQADFGRITLPIGPTDLGVLIDGGGAKANEVLRFVTLKR